MAGRAADTLASVQLAGVSRVGQLPGGGKYRNSSSGSAHWSPSATALMTRGSAGAMEALLLGSLADKAHHTEATQRAASLTLPSFPHATIKAADGLQVVQAQIGQTILHLVWLRHSEIRILIVDELG